MLSAILLYQRFEIQLIQLLDPAELSTRVCAATCG